MPAAEEWTIRAAQAARSARVRDERNFTRTSCKENYYVISYGSNGNFI
jgi:hypothetical protein